MKYTLAIYGAPVSSEASESAFRFAEAACRLGHEVVRVFFYGDGVHNGSALVAAPQDEQALPPRWQALAEKHQIDLVVCVAAALRRGIIDQAEAQRYEKSAANLAGKFEISGLGQLLEGTVISDRVISFGA